jgi:hypothetical protein
MGLRYCEEDLEDFGEDVDFWLCSGEAGRTSEENRGKRKGWDQSISSR